MATLTFAQEKAIEIISSKFENVKIAEVSKYGAFVTFDNGKDNIFLHQAFQVKIGKRGAIHFICVHAFDADKKHQRVLAKLAGYALKIRKFYVMLY